MTAGATRSEPAQKARPKFEGTPAGAGHQATMRVRVVPVRALRAAGWPAAADALERLPAAADELVRATGMTAGEVAAVLAESSSPGS